MIDIMVQYPGASAQQVANMAMQPLERIMSEIPGVKHVYSASQRGQGIVTVEFDVGQPMGPSLVKVNDKLASNMDKIPPGVLPPLVKSKGIDDVPIVTLTLWSKDMDKDGVPDVDDGQLRLLAQDVLQALGRSRTPGHGMIVGGRREQVTVDVAPGAPVRLPDQPRPGRPDPARPPTAETTAGGVESSGSHFTVTTGSFLKGVDEINRLVVGTHNDVPVYIQRRGTGQPGPGGCHPVGRLLHGSGGGRRPGHGPGPPGGDHRRGQEGTDQRRDRRQRHHRPGGGAQGQPHPQQRRGQHHPQLRPDRGSRRSRELIFKLFEATVCVFLLVLGRLPRPAPRHRGHADHPGGAA